MSHMRPRAICGTTRAVRRFASAPFLLLALCASILGQQAKMTSEQPAPASSSPPTSRTVTLAVTVTDEKGRYISGLDKELFTISDGGATREITSFSSAGEPASVGVLFDISNSILSRKNLIEAMRRAFVRFAQHSSPQNEYFLRAFNKKDLELTDWTRDAGALNEGLSKISADAVPTKGSGGTALYDACAASMKNLAGGSQRKRVLLVFTDGLPDNASRAVEFKNLKRMVRDSGALIYFVAVVEPGLPASLSYQATSELDELAANSGGRAFFPETVVELNEIVDRMAVELSQQYMISFVPADVAKKGELNKLKVKVKPPPNFKNSIYVRYREGYFTPE
jgi:Ca-activated chloride channel family protein